MLTESEYKKKISDAFARADYSELIILANDMVEDSYATLANNAHLSADHKHDIPEGTIFNFFRDHDFAPVLIKKGLAALHVGDPSLAGRSLEDAIKSIPVDSHFAEPFFYLAFLQAASGYTVASKETITAGLKKNPQLLEKFDEYYQAVEFSALPDYKEKFRALCKASDNEMAGVLLNSRHV